MAPGPLPKDPDQRVRRNEPTIPTTKLPAGGFTGRRPSVPKAYSLAAAGKAWWAWAWKTPQAAAWSPGDTYLIARRAQLEDDLAALALVPEVAIGDILHDAIGTDLDDRKEVRKLEEALDWLLSSLQRRAGGSGPVMREMREIDDRLGLTPKGLAALRWNIVPDAPTAAAPNAKPAAKPQASRGGLRRVAAVDLG